MNVLSLFYFLINFFIVTFCWCSARGTRRGRVSRPCRLTFSTSSIFAYPPLFPVMVFSHNAVHLHLLQGRPEKAIYQPKRRFEATGTLIFALYMHDQPQHTA